MLYPPRLWSPPSMFSPHPWHFIGLTEVASSCSSTFPPVSPTAQPLTPLLLLLSSVPTIVTERLSPVAYLIIPTAIRESTEYSNLLSLPTHSPSCFSGCPVPSYTYLAPSPFGPCFVLGDSPAHVFTHIHTSYPGQSLPLLFHQTSGCLNNLTLSRV